MRSAPSFLVWLISSSFLGGVVTSTMTLISRWWTSLQASTRSSGTIVEPFIAESNRFLAAELSHMHIRPITLKEVRSYYREDAFIWRLYLGLRKFDRFLHRNVMKKPYMYILPGKIKR